MALSAVDAPLTDVCVDVVVVSTNRRDLVMQCVTSLDDPAVATITVVVNASTDGTEDALRVGRPDVRIVPMNRTASLPETNNRGAATGSAPFVLFLNDDILATQRAITRLVRVLSHRPNAVGAGGRLVDPATLTTQDQYRPRTQPGLGVFALQLLEIERLWPSNPITQRHWGAGLNDHSLVDIEQPPGACLLVRRDAFEQVGGFDEALWVWFEDTDLTRRLLKLGSLLYEPKAVFRHLGGQSVGRWTQADVVRSRLHGMIRYAERHFPPLHRRALGGLLLVASLPRALLFARRRPAVASAYRAAGSAAIALLWGRDAPSLVSDLHQTQHTAPPK